MSAPQACFLGLGGVGDSSVLLWPMVAKELRATDVAMVMTCYEPDVFVRTPCLKPLTELSGWTASSFEVRSPASLASRSPGLGAGRRLLSVKASEEAPLLETVAKQAFWNLGHPFLQPSCRHLQIDISESSCLFDTLSILLRQALPGASEHEVLDLCGRRVSMMAGKASKESYEDLLELEGSTEFLTKDDVGVLRKETTKANDHAAQVDEFRQALVAKRAALPRRPGGASNSSSGSGGASSSRRRSIPKHGLISHEQAKELSPPGSYVWRSHGSGPWCGRMPPKPREDEGLVEVG